jgi:hypothetical protein
MAARRKDFPHTPLPRAPWTVRWGRWSFWHRTRDWLACFSGTGSLTGFGGGLDIKRRLLVMEGALLDVD